MGKGRPQKYNRVTCQQKFMLRRLITKQNMSVKQASEALSINYSTAKTIMFCYRQLHADTNSISNSFLKSNMNTSADHLQMEAGYAIIDQKTYKEYASSYLNSLAYSCSGARNGNNQYINSNYTTKNGNGRGQFIGKGKRIQIISSIGGADWMKDNLGAGEIHQSTQELKIVKVENSI